MNNHSVDIIDLSDGADEYSEENEVTQKSLTHVVTIEDMEESWIKPEYLSVADFPVGKLCNVKSSRGKVIHD